MSPRLKRMRILLRAQEQMQLNAKRAVDKATKELDILRKKELALLTLMAEGDSLMVNTLMNSHVNQIKQVSKLKSDMQTALKTLKQETTKQAVFMEAIKRMTASLEKEERQNAEKREQQQIIEQAAQRGEVG